MVGGLFDRLKDTLRRTGTPRLDFLQLSGKSSQIPAVRATAAGKLSSGANGTVVLRADELQRVGHADLKECVVYGAALWFGGGNSGTVAFAKSGGDQRTTSRIGIMRADSGFQALIGLDEVIDSTDGIVSEEHDLFWDGSSAIAIYENLSEIDDARLDGEQNLHAVLIAQFVAAESDAAEIARWAAEHPGEPLKMHLRLAPDLELEAFVTLPGAQDYRLERLR
jgi:hypothetical protein